MLHCMVECKEITKQDLIQSPTKKILKGNITTFAMGHLEYASTLNSCLISRSTLTFYKS